ncbi:MAG TPA: hypothetical protein VJ378_01410 [Candidatus Paceibacterota bacterium]|nr:hypothetical protein [Candidatus Paceibacterota bacterium]
MDNFFERDILKNQESRENQEIEPKKVYINDVFLGMKNKLREYFPNFYREIPTKLNYKDNSEDLNIDHHFENEKLNINIKTPEDLSNKTPDELRVAESDFLVFKDIAKKEKISKKTQDFFFLSHEYIHGINQVLLKEYRPDILKMEKAGAKRLAGYDESKRNEILRKESENSIISALRESLPISFEKIITEKFSQDKTIDNTVKESVKKFWETHEQSLSLKKLETKRNSKYSELDEAMVCYKIYQEFGEKGIIDFIRNLNVSKLSEIKKYLNVEKKVISEEYKKFLDMDANEIIKEFTTVR